MQVKGESLMPLGPKAILFFSLVELRFHPNPLPLFTLESKFKSNPEFCKWHFLSKDRKAVQNLKLKLHSSNSEFIIMEIFAVTNEWTVFSIYEEHVNLNLFCWAIWLRAKSQRQSRGSGARVTNNKQESNKHQERKNQESRDRSQEQNNQTASRSY